MYPHERSLVKQLAGQPFAIIGVNTDSHRETIAAICKEKNITWRSFFDGPDGPIADQWDIKAWPTVYLLDAQGKIRYRNARGKRLDEAITKLLAEIDIEVDITHDEEGEG
jgi:hypothetical protein